MYLVFCYVRKILFFIIIEKEVIIVVIFLSLSRRALQDQTDQALGDVQGQLSQSESELTKAIDRNRNMEQQQLQLDNQVKELKQEINTLRTSMTQLDQEKDQLLVRIHIDYIFSSPLQQNLFQAI